MLLKKHYLLQCTATIIIAGLFYYTYRYDLQVHRYNVDSNLNTPANDNIDEYWCSVEKTGRYPKLCRIIFSVLSIITAPKVESLFSIMNNVIDQHSTRMNIETASMIQTIKYHLKSHRVSAHTFFDIKHDDFNSSMDAHLYKNMKLASMRRVSDHRAQKIKKDAQLACLQSKRKLASKQSDKEARQTETKRSRLSFYKDQRKTVLENLVLKRRARKNKE